MDGRQHSRNRRSLTAGTCHWMERNSGRWCFPPPKSRHVCTVCLFGCFCYAHPTSARWGATSYIDLYNAGVYCEQNIQIARVIEESVSARWPTVRANHLQKRGNNSKCHYRLSVALVYLPLFSPSRPARLRKEEKKRVCKSVNSFLFNHWSCHLAKH